MQDENHKGLLFLLLWIILIAMILVGLSTGCYYYGYKSGQVDARKGIWKFEVLMKEDGSFETFKFPKETDPSTDLK